MKAQASAALGVILVWLLANNLQVSARITSEDLGERAQDIALKELEPLISQLAIAGLVGSVVVWLTGGVLRKIISLISAGFLIYLGILTINIILNPVSGLPELVTLSGELESAEVGPLTYLLVLTSLLSGILYLLSVKTYSGDKTSRPRLNSDRDKWRDQDAGNDPTR
jgi:hypothetical protein